jgi:hypothetical protein
MGQAVVDLPDPIEKPPAGGNADDLLSQLAGDEIDRLLGEAEVEKAAAESAPADAAPVADAAAPVAEAPEPVTPVADIAKQVEVAKAEIATVAAPETPAPIAPAASNDLDQAIAAHADTVLGPSTTTPTEQHELLASETDAVEEDIRTPLLLRPLEWFSSPLDTLSPGTRDFLGKAAIVTLVNSAAVIAYVIWFRK